MHEDAAIERDVSRGIEHLRQRLGARVADCFDRLDDVISELCALHSVDADEIVARVRATLEREEHANGRSASG